MIFFLFSCFVLFFFFFFFFSSRRRHTRSLCDWSSTCALPISASVDGISTISVRSNGLLIEMFPSAESIDEIKVSSVSNNAEFAQVGDVTTTTRGGANAYRGSLYWYHQNGAFDARDFSLPARNLS